MDIPSDLRSVTYNGVSFTHGEIHAVVAEFYGRVQDDALLKTPFASVHDWSEHVARLTHFWWLRFGGEPYMWSQYNPVLKHFHAGFNEALLKRWLSLFGEVLAEKLSREQAQAWGGLADVMGRNLHIRNEMLRRQTER